MSVSDSWSLQSEQPLATAIFNIITYYSEYDIFNCQLANLKIVTTGFAESLQHLVEKSGITEAIASSVKFLICTSVAEPW